jgi:CRISPR-associated protein Cas5d
MKEKNYLVEVEVAGPLAIFTRPDSGSSPVSYEAPTFSAAKGIFESIAYLKSAWIRPTQVEICRPIRFHRYKTNYHGPLRKSDQIRKGDPYQLPAVVLADVCYRLYGVVEEITPSPVSTNHLHALQEMFLRRAGKGQSFRPVCLGWSEFLCSYVGPFRSTTQVDKSINLTIPTMLHSVFSRPVNGEYAPIFRQAVEVRSGCLEYAL